MAGHYVATCAKNTLLGRAGCRNAQVALCEVADFGKALLVGLSPVQWISFTVNIRRLEVGGEFLLYELGFSKTWGGAQLFEKTANLLFLFSWQLW